MTEESKQEIIKQKLEEHLNKRLESLLEKFQNDINTLESLKYNFYDNCIIKLQNYSSPKNSDIKEEPEEKTEEKKEEKEKKEKKEEKEEKTEEKIEEKKEEKKEEEQKTEETNKEEKKPEKKVEHLKKIDLKKDANSMRSKTPVKVSNMNKKRIKEDKSKDIMNKTITNEKKNPKEAKKENKGMKKDLSKDKLDNKLKPGVSKDKLDNSKPLKGSKTKATAGFKKNTTTQAKNEKKKDSKDKKKDKKKEKEEKQEEKEEETNEKEEENVEEQPKQIEIKPAFIYTLPESISQNKPISAIFMMLEKKFLPIKQRFKIITSNLNLYKNCYNSNIKFLLEEQLKNVENSMNSIENRFKNYSEADLKTYLTKEFTPSKVAQNSLTFITKEEEKNLSEKTNLPIEIKHIFQVVYHLLDEHFDEKKPASFLIKHLLNEVCSKHNAKDLKNLIINYYNKHKHLNLSPEKFNKIEKIIKENPKILNNKEIVKINRPISYLTFYINEAYKYMNLKTKDDIYYYQVRHLNEQLNKYKENIKKIKSALNKENEEKKEEKKEEKNDEENGGKSEIGEGRKENEKNEEEKKES